jgi:hypothetical protein
LVIGYFILYFARLLVFLQKELHRIMETVYTSPSAAIGRKKHKPVDYVSSTPTERLHTVEEFVDKLEEAVRVRL